MAQSETPWTDEWLEDKTKQVIEAVIGSPNTATIPISGNTASEERPSIFRIEGQTDAEVMCIGIFAKRDNYFSRNDNNKWLYVVYLTQWLGLKHTMYREEITKRVTLARSYYKELPPPLDDQLFVECLFLDGCCLAFLIALLQASHDTYSQILKGNGHDDEQNRVFSFLYQEIMQNKMTIKLDMLKANNQIPWFVVEAVFQNSNLKTPEVAKFALSCFSEFYPNIHKDKVNCNLPTNQIKHLLHMFLWSRTSGPILVDLNSNFTYASGTGLYIPSATDLQESATDFKALTGASIGFTNTRVAGKMQVAPLHLFPYSIEMFRNLIDFEQNFFAGGFAITSYIACMVRLLQSEDDVQLLRKRGIVGNTMKTNKEVLEFMEELRAKIGDAFIEDDLHKLSERVIKHHQRRRGRQYADLQRRLCSNTWLTFSVIAGVMIFVFTALQAVFGILSYYKKS